MSAAELFRVGPASEYADLNRRYQEAAAALQEARREHDKLLIAVAKWGTREEKAKRLFDAVVQEFELKGWMLP